MLWSNQVCTAMAVYYCGHAPVAPGRTARDRGALFTICLLTVLLLVFGDIEANPGPPVTAFNTSQYELRVGSINVYSAVNKIECVLNAIDEEQLDILTVTESFIRENHPTAIKNDPAPPGYTITHAHRTLGVKAKGGGIAVIAVSICAHDRSSKMKNFPRLSSLPFILPFNPAVSIC